MLDQIEQRLLGPVQVIEDANEGPLLCLLLEQLAEAPRDLLRQGRLVRLAQQRAQWLGGDSRGQRAELPENLHGGPVGDPLAVRDAAAANGPGIDPVQELGHEPRLAHTR